MKIHPTVPALPVAPAGVDSRPAERAEDKGERAARVSLSGDAQFAAQVADAIRTSDPIRPDVVEATKAALADGSYERAVDFDRLIDRLLADL